MKTTQKILLSSIFILGTQVTSGMEEMKAINCWEDALTFLGKVVVYSADGDYYSVEGKGYQISEENNDLKAGFIAQLLSNNCGIDMKRLLKKDSVPGTCYLYESTLEKANLMMREATSQERAKILDAINTKQAKLDYMLFWEGEFRKELNK